MVRPAVQRKAGEHVQQILEIIQLRACAVRGVDRSSMRHAPPIVMMATCGRAS